MSGEHAGVSEARPHLPLSPEGRYARLQLLPWWDQDLLRHSLVVVAGAGALGNEVLKCLALAGVGTLVVIDSDRIELSNLSRSVLYRAQDVGKAKALVAAARVRQLNPEISAVGVVGDLRWDIGTGLYRRAAVVLGCLDNREARWTLNRDCWRVGTPWVDGGIRDLMGTVRVFVPWEGPCYACALGEVDKQLLNQRDSCGARDAQLQQRGHSPTTPTVAAIIGAMQAQEALKLIHGLGQWNGEGGFYNGWTNTFYPLRYQRKPECELHSPPLPVVELAGGTARASAADLYRWLGEQGVVADELELDRQFVVGLRCGHCHARQSTLRPRRPGSDARFLCPRCGETRIPELRHRIGRDSGVGERPLSALGVPRWHVLVARGAGARVGCELTGDAEAVLLGRRSARGAARR